MNHDLFFEKMAVDINRSRIDHLESLDLEFKDKTILETGCGAKGDFTMYFLSKGAKVTINDARISNIENLLKVNNISIDSNTYDLNQEISCNKFDIIFCYGTLYHLHDPTTAIKNMYNICNEYILLSTVINNRNDNHIDYVQENSNAENQSFTNIGCRPSKKWIINELYKHFKNVYTCKTSPNHPDYKNESGTPRAIFLASDKEINSKYFEKLINI